MVILETLIVPFGRQQLARRSMAGELRGYVHRLARPDLVLTLCPAANSPHPESRDEDCLLIDANVRLQLHSCIFLESVGELLGDECTKCHRRRQSAILLIAIEQCEDTISPHIYVRGLEEIEQAHRGVGE